MMRGFLSNQATVRGSTDLCELVTELIDAHADTVELLLADEPDEFARWAHLEYLRALQRLGHETLAHHDLSSSGTAPLPGVTRAARRAVAQGGTSATKLLTKCSAPVAILVRAAAPVCSKACGLDGTDEPTRHHGQSD